MVLILAAKVVLRSGIQSVNATSTLSTGHHMPRCVPAPPHPSQLSPTHPVFSRPPYHCSNASLPHLLSPHPPRSLTIPFTSLLSSSSRKQWLHHRSMLSPAILFPKSICPSECCDTKKRTSAAACGWRGAISERCLSIRVRRRRLCDLFFRFLTM